MKKILLIAAGLSLGVATTSCSLEKFPETMYAENNTSGTGDSETAINTRELLEGQLTAMYNYMKGDLQTYWYQLTTLAEARADNAYGGNMAETKVVSVESNHIDSDNEFASNLWNYSMNAVDYANQVICNIDLVKENDPSLTDKEYQEWLSEALCWRAYIWMNMMQLFGEIPMLTEIPPAINAGNVEEVYPLYFPARVSKQTVGEQIVKDIEEYACKYAPDMDASNKFRITKGFAYGLMARFYTDEKNSLFSDVDIVPEIVGIIEKDIKYLENMQMVQDKNDMIDEMFPWDELSDDDFPVAVTEILFDDRCHYHELWKGEDLQEETVLSFLDKQRDYLRIMNLSSFNELYFVKSDQEIIEALGKLRWVDNFVDIVYEVLNKDKDFSDMSIIGIRKALWKIFDVAKEHKIMWQGRNFTEDSFMQEDLLTICRWIMEI